MAFIQLRYPSSSIVSASITLNPAYVTVQPFEEQPQQRLLIAESLKEYVYEVTSNVETLYEMNCRLLPEADDTSGNAGMVNLRLFIASTLNFMQNTFDLTDADGSGAQVRFVEGYNSVRETGEARARDIGLFSARFVFRRTIG